jgi:hypothetical protein
MQRTDFRAGPIQHRNISRLAVALLPLAGALLGTSSSAAEPHEPLGAEAQILSSLEDWFTALARQEADTILLGETAALPNVSLSFTPGPDSDLRMEDLPRWVETLRTEHPRVEYRLAGIEIDRMQGETYDIRFALERRSVESTGLSHIARWAERWRIRIPASASPTVLAISEEPRLAFPGTGPQIVCF